MTRWMKRWGWIGGLVFLAVPAMAATVTAKFGTLQSGITTAVATTDAILADGQGSLVIQATGTPATSGVTCQQSADGITFANIGTALSNAIGIVCTITNPVGFYKASVTSCTSCTINILYRRAHPQ